MCLRVNLTNIWGTSADRSVSQWPYWGKWTIITGAVTVSKRKKSISCVPSIIENIQRSPWPGNNTKEPRTHHSSYLRPHLGIEGMAFLTCSHEQQWSKLIPRDTSRDCPMCRAIKMSSEVTSRWWTIHKYEESVVGIKNNDEHVGGVRPEGE